MKLVFCGVLILAIVACSQSHTLKKRSLDQLLGGGLGNLFGASSGGGSSGGGFDIASLLQSKLGALSGGSSAGNSGGNGGWSSGGQGGWSSGRSGRSHDHVDKVIYVKIIEENLHHDNGHGGWNSGWNSGWNNGW